MAFHQVGDFWLAPGQSTRIHIARGNLINEAEWGGEILARSGSWPTVSASIRYGSW
ncbi:MAG: hypothetical protein H0X47_10435 [Nitrospirales bacterium]|nr:hypothetical protein [Nitrospirales bacterium]